MEIDLDDFPKENIILKSHHQWFYYVLSTIKRLTPLDLADVSKENGLTES